MNENKNAPYQSNTREDAEASACARMSRRSFLQNAVLAAGSLGTMGAIAGLGGCSPAGRESDPDRIPGSKGVETKTVDVVVIGSGAAGLSAALTAKGEGASVIVLEALSQPGGATLFSHGTMIATSQLQKDGGVEETAEDVLETYISGITDENLIEMAKMYSESVGETYDWLAQTMKVEFEDGLVTVPVYPKPRLAYMKGGGSGAVDTLMERIEESDIEMLFDTEATELVKEDGKVVGVIASAAGTQYDIRAKGVVLAGGGFAANDDMLVQSLVDACFYGSASSMGRAYDMALHAGAVLHELDNIGVDPNGIETSPGKAIHTAFPSLAVFTQAAGILVGLEGKRIVDETSNGPAQVAAYRTQPDSTAYLFMDQSSFDVYYSVGTADATYIFSPETMNGWIEQDNDKLPIIVKADTVEGAASEIGIDAKNLKATIETFNSGLDAGVDPEFGRPMTTAIGEGPYYIIKQSLRYAHSYGGVLCNGDMQVVDWERTPIPGLYAAGEIVSTMQGRWHKSGTTTSFAFTSGRRAAMCLLESK